MKMTSHQISIRSAVFERLKNLKKEDESYSDTINRLIDAQGNVDQVLECYGTAVKDDKEILLFYERGKEILRSQLSDHFNKKIKE